MLLGDEFFFVAHDDTTGKSRLHATASGLGLAAALLAELLFINRIAIQSGSLAVIDNRPPDDWLAHMVLDQLVSEPQHRSVRTWLAFLGQTARESVAQRLLRSGRVRTNQVRRTFRTMTVYPPVDTSAAAWPESRLRHLLNTGKPMSLDDAALVGLISATGLCDRILWDAHADAHRYLAHVLDTLPTPLQELNAHAEAAIGDATLSRR